MYNTLFRDFNQLTISSKDMYLTPGTLFMLNGIICQNIGYNMNNMTLYIKYNSDDNTLYRTDQSHITHILYEPNLNKTKSFKY